MKEILVTLLIWISQNSVFEIPDPNEYPLPTLTFMSQNELHHMATNSTLNEDTFFMIRASYFPETNTIYLPHDTDIDTLHFESMLLHELVHHVQNINGISYLCNGHVEKDAYTLEIEYLLQKGVKDPYEMMGLHPLTLIFITQCRGDVFK